MIALNKLPNNRSLNVFLFLSLALSLFDFLVVLIILGPNTMKNRKWGHGSGYGIRNFRLRRREMVFLLFVYCYHYTVM